MVKNNYLQIYISELTINNFLWEELFYHVMLSFDHKIVHVKTPICYGTWMVIE